MAKSKKIDRYYKTIKADPVRVKPSYKSRKIKTLEPGKVIHATKINGHYVYVPALKGWTIWKDSKGQKYVRLLKVAPSAKADKLIRSLKAIAVKLKKTPMKWANSPGASTLAQSLKKHRINCACYVSYGLQDIGILGKGKTIWLDKKIHGKGAAQIKKKAKVVYPRKIPAKAGLKKGDICGFAKAPHTMVYAGKDKAGHLLWYSAGGSDVKPKKYGPKRKKRYENKKVMVRIRLK